MTPGRSSPQLETDRVLIVEDEPGQLELLKDELVDLGLQVRTASDGERGVAESRAWVPDLIVSDLRLPGVDGLELLRRSREGSPPPSFIVITAFGTVRQAVEALRQGADDFLTKPLDLDHLRLRVTRVLETRRLRQQLVRYEELLGDDGFHGMVGRSRPMQQLYSQIRQVARGSGPVLILGESGSGKELVARAVHEESDRRDRQFLAVNCAGIPESLIESELFGHVAGAFTGASRGRKGLFAEADGGVLLLDEISETPLPLQAKLLRVLQEGTVRAVGADKERPVDVRILAATHRDLAEAVRQGAFREDLYYRLETFTLKAPPLRERDDDLELLTARFLQRCAAAMDKDVRTITPEALERLRAYPFPGNVRELQNAIERAVAFCESGSIRIEDLPPRMRGASTPAPGRDSEQSPVPKELLGELGLPSLAELENRYIQYVVERVGGNKRRAAALLGIGRRTLYRRLGEANSDG